MESTDELMIQSEQVAAAEAAAEAQRELARQVMNKLEAKRERWEEAVRPLWDRMIRDLRQLEGICYRVSETKRDHGGMDSQGGPPVLKTTRSRTNKMASRIWDMLFPTTGAQFRGEPEPIQDDPSLNIDLAGNDPRVLQAQTPEEAEAIKRQVIDEIESEIKRRVQKFEKRIADDLIESGFKDKARKVIWDACEVGFGLLIGPQTRVKRKDRYIEAKVVGPDGVAEIDVQVEIVETKCAGVEYGDPFMFIPDPVPSLDMATGAFYCELMSEQDLRDMLVMKTDSGMPAADIEAIAELLSKPPEHEGFGQTILSRHKQIGFEEHLDGRYIVWRYVGTMTHDEWKCIAPPGMEVDPLRPMPMVEIFYCQRKPIMMRFSTQVDRIPFNVFAPFPDRGHWAGLSVPFMMRDEDKAIQSGHQIALHNLAVSSGPLVFYRGKLYSPDGQMLHRGPKFYRVDESDQPLGDLIRVETIPHMADQAFAFVDRMMSFADENLAMPDWTNPDVNRPTNTASGMAMWMNAMTIGQRAAAAAFDSMMGPMLKDFVRWISRYAIDDPDYKIAVQMVPLGQEELLVKDVQLQNAMMMTQLASSNPEIAKRIDHGVLAKHLIRKFELPPGAELDEEKVKANEQNAQQNPELAFKERELAIRERQVAIDEAKAKAEEADKLRDDDFRSQDRMLDHKERMAEIQSREQIALMNLQAKQMDMELAAAKLAMDERISIAEAQARLGIAEMREQTARMAASMNARLKAEQIATADREMALKLSPANPTNTGI